MRHLCATRPLAGLLLAAVAGSGLFAGAPPASAATSDAGLYGSADPTYDGVYRQSLAILGLLAAGQAPDPSAVGWLLAQRCADGAFTAYRADPSTACSAAEEDENATATAVMALAALGRPTASSLTALERFQLPDGGFYDSTAFGPAASDANSTGLALSALAAAGVDPASVTASGKSGEDYLRSLQLPCSAATGAGGYDFQGEASLAANDYATAQAALGQLGKALPVAPVTVAAGIPACVAATDTPTSASDAVAYLAARLSANGGAIPSALGGGTDWTTTANAVLDLVAAGSGSAAMAAGLAALQANVPAYAHAGATYAAGALGTLLLVAHATGVDPKSFGGTDLVAALTATLRTAPAPAAAGPALPMTGDREALPLALAGTGVLLLGIGLVVASRRSRERSGGEPA